MLEATGDLWAFPSLWHVITTNGAVRRDGAAVMGRGVALQAKQRFPGIEFQLGAALACGGNRVYMWEEHNLITMPVKHLWHQPADLALIHRSLFELQRLEVLSVALPRPGCGNGGLKWADVKPLCMQILDHRFTVVSLPNEA